MDLKDKIRTIPDFPKPGIMFRDITTLMVDHDAFQATLTQLAALTAGDALTAEEAPDYVAGIEARGFIFGAALADRLGVGFVPVRKSGKLPGDCYSREYELEYGTDRLEVHKDAFPKGARVLLVDDLLATGGTAIAAADLLVEAGATVTGAAFVIDLPDLGGSKRLAELGFPVHSLVAFEGH